MLVSIAVDSVVRSLTGGKLPKVSDNNAYEALVCSLVAHFAKQMPRGVPEAYLRARLEHIRGQQKQLRRLMKLPKTAQRSPEWYLMRDTMITASDFALAVGRGKFAKPKDFYRKKCGFDVIPFDGSSAPLVWGVKYEEVAQDIYSQRTGMKMHEFGLLRHPDISYVGASPDGITEFGTMVEIKCPYRRQINGEVPEQYYYQIQGQLEVCGLEECDYWECSLKEYATYADFDADWDDTETMTRDWREKGVIMEWRVRADSEERQYEYSGAYRTRAELAAWEEETMDRITAEHGEDVSMRFTYWYLHDSFLKRIPRDPRFWESLAGCLDTVWTRIQTLRQDRAMYDLEAKKRPSDAFMLPYPTWSKRLEIGGSGGCGGGSLLPPREVSSEPNSSAREKQAIEHLVQNYVFRDPK